MWVGGWAEEKKGRKQSGMEADFDVLEKIKDESEQKRKVWQWTKEMWRLKKDLLTLNILAVAVLLS